MGKVAAYQQRQGCSDESAPICGSKCCNTPTTEFVKYDDLSPPTQNNDDAQDDDDIHSISPPTKTNDDAQNNGDIHELLIIGAGPHSHALMLRLLSHEPDFLSEKERHKMAEYKERMRPPRDVNNYLRRLCRGPKATLKPPRKKRSKGLPILPPPLTLEEINKFVLVVDSYGSWMEGRKKNFRALKIPQLRSLMSAHNDPFDHRALEYYAEMRKRGDELITLPNLKQKDLNFKGPYQVPSTAIFNEFHDLLSSAYGIGDAVTKGTVLSITPRQLDDDDEAMFEVVIQTPTKVRRIVKTKRVVAALGPMFRPLEMPWISDLPPMATRRILHSHQICPFINHLEEQKKSCNIGKVLIVGGGITSAQLSLLASKSKWCTGVIFIQRSSMKPRHFDIKNEWMGPKRGKMLEEFWACSDMNERAKQLKEARGGGTIPPEIIEELLASQGPKLEVKTEVEIEEVEWNDDHFRVSLTDGSECKPAMVWISTGAQNHIDHYTVLSKLRDVLPVNVVNGLPVLDNDLSWMEPDGNDEPRWKQVARKRVYCCGVLSGLQCGPDSLNLIGARHGSIKVAQSIRHDIEVERLRELDDATSDESVCESCC